MNLKENKILDKAYVIAKTVMSHQDFYLSEDCNANHKQLLETMIGAAIWYLPQVKELWTGDISIGALKKFFESDNPKKIKLTKDHHYPRKFSAAELFKLNWSTFLTLLRKSCISIRIYIAVLILFYLKRIKVLSNIRKDMCLEVLKIYIERLVYISETYLKNN